MITLKVTGMDCNHCVASVTQAVGQVPGTQSVVVDLATGNVQIEGAPDQQAVRAAIERAGYEVAA